LPAVGESPVPAFPANPPVPLEALLVGALPVQAGTQHSNGALMKSRRIAAMRSVEIMTH